jgi:formate-dependent nitrite reductase membrane component NrfD
MSAEPRSYYGQPVIKEPTWTPEIPFYLFTGGLAGASAGLAFLAEQAGNEELARRAWLAALAGVTVSPALLISDLGVPSRFLNMLRMFKVRSPMSVGSWILSASGLTTAVATTEAMTGLLRGPARVAKPAAAALGLPLATYTGALLAQTAVPVWHEARRHLPFAFAASAAATAGAAALTVTPVEHAAPARRLTTAGAVAQIASMVVMEQSLADMGNPYSEGPAGALKRASIVLTAAGAATVAARGARSRAAAAAGGAAVLAGALCDRFSIFRAGFQSARDPAATVGPQRARADERGTAASRHANGRP